MSGQEPKNDGSLFVGAAKATLMVLGGLVAFGIMVSLIKPLAFAAIVGGAGYLGYRALSRRRALPAAPRAPRALEGKSAKAPPGDDFERRMRELEEVERRLDSQIGKY